MAVETYEMKLELRPGKATDFFHHTKDGEKKYLFGKVYAIRHKPDQWSFVVFRNSPLARLQFNACYERGLVYVIANADDMGILD